ncbi:hypothetical protein BJF85_00290 [Saccharomonospora sp. CUA-673]|uniref:NAD(P)-dependent oxidoreductase n=1 Tax=Saccharomonospora sp. CUA-673 TaxID=1904969 RepID=UPI0009621B6B|nr:NAD(P)H-binding protein [Saccharomonospora sp. CUA-673]OLT46946.1 hypothetical protein BJF85_00290 [Saccharomonospora sp. CUA-673]
MHVVVAGASGGTGRQVVAQAIDAGHRVTALVRDAGRYSAPDGVQVRQVDIFREREFDLPGDTDVVISALGNTSFDKPLPVCRRGTEHLLAAMRRNDIRRLLVTSAAPLLWSSTAEPLPRRVFMGYVRWAGRRVFADLAAMEATLRRARHWCEWTIVRPGPLSDADHPGEFELVLEDNARDCSTRRPDLAAALLRLAQDPSTIGHAFGIASR